MKVMKFGGGCLKNDEDFLKVAELIKNERAGKSAIVVSAINGITNKLESAINTALHSEDLIMAIDNNDIQKQYDERAMNDCKKQSAYCVASIALFIAAGIIGTPGIVTMIPGGALTVGLAGLGIVVLVIMLCKLQM